ncbi:MAG: hypothetical protein U0528_09510 [Anaerolineae bacterium]
MTQIINADSVQAFKEQVRTQIQDLIQQARDLQHDQQPSARQHLQDQVQEVLHQIQHALQRQQPGTWRQFQDQVQDILQQVQQSVRRPQPSAWQQLQDQLQELIHNVQKSGFHVRPQPSAWQRLQDQLQEAIQQAQKPARRSTSTFAKRWRDQDDDEPAGAGVLAILFGVGIGMALMYLFDPQHGHRRRANLRDRLLGVRNEVGDQVTKLGGKAEYAADRMRGVVAEAKNQIVHPPVEDSILVEHIRAHLGRLVALPGAVEVEVIGGRVFLRGDVLASEVDPLLAHLQAMNGVRYITNELKTHQSVEEIVASRNGQPRANGVAPQ